MFYRPVSELWPEMLDLLARCGHEDNAGACGEILFMLGGNLGTLRGDYHSARQFLVRATRYAQQRKDDYLLARCLRKYGDYLRYRGHLRLSNSVLSEALSLSVGARGSRQRVYVLGCLGDLERQKHNYSASREYFETAMDLAKAAFIPGWLGNLHIGLAEIAIERNMLDEARRLLDQAEAHYRKTRPKHWWGEIQVGLGRSRLMRSAGEPSWVEVAQATEREALAAGYLRDANFARRLLAGDPDTNNVLMFL
jgi:tetratricopeptide (TPR) repeat protein